MASSARKASAISSCVSAKLRRKGTKSVDCFSHICVPAARNACSAVAAVIEPSAFGTLCMGKMARTESSMLPLVTPAPSFTLADVLSGKKVGLEDFRDEKALLVMFICRHCPFVEHVQSELAKLGRDYAGRSLGIIAISSNDADAYPDDASESLAEMASGIGFNNQRGCDGIPDPHDRRCSCIVGAAPPIPPSLFPLSRFESGLHPRLEAVNAEMSFLWRATRRLDHGPRSRRFQLMDGRRSARWRSGALNTTPPGGPIHAAYT
jgi:AhpC/TSA family